MRITYNNGPVVFKVTISCSDLITLAVLKFLRMDSMQMLKCTDLTSCFHDV